MSTTGPGARRSRTFPDRFSGCRIIACGRAATTDQEVAGPNPAGRAQRKIHHGCSTRRRSRRSGTRRLQHQMASDLIGALGRLALTGVHHASATPSPAVAIAITSSSDALARRSPCLGTSAPEQTLAQRGSRSWRALATFVARHTGHHQIDVTAASPPCRLTALSAAGPRTHS